MDEPKKEKQPILAIWRRLMEKAKEKMKEKKQKEPETRN